MIPAQLPAEILAGLRRIAGEANVRLETPPDSVPPDGQTGGVTVYPSSAAAVGEIIEMARRGNVPVLVREAGAPPDAWFPLVNRAAAEKAAGPAGIVITISLEHMKDVRYVNRECLSLLAEPGATVDGIKREAERAGVVCPAGPQAAAACFVGNCARCGITGCVADHIHGLEVVLSSGELTSIGGEGTRDLDEYQLTYLLTKGEHLSAVITGVYVKLHAGD
ncbi:FAD-binding oxidoreductase [Desulfotomaculum copahuensis]|uniref:FAD-binding PCMH-type domain-containing protein n=1 Tax=Desulfotomaculum copahuensis TaxID=1838280 RepID=A0A1B7LF80_9FIRM|nr:FAD-binding protein [Desulfotomaculum copahuensis]OAT82274.1 hypothetical protein A6M21_08940 [Desulfotomaculum copahuensis]